MPPGLQGCCCSRHRHGDSSAASSEEDAVASGDARLQRCVRTVAPNLLVDGSYAYVAKVGFQERNFTDFSVMENTAYFWQCIYLFHS